MGIKNGMFVIFRSSQHKAQIFKRAGVSSVFLKTVSIFRKQHKVYDHFNFLKTFDELLRK